MGRVLLIIGMVASMLWSTSGVVLLRHYCGGELKMQGLYSIPEGDQCQHLLEKNTCHHLPTPNQKSCCHSANTQEAITQTPQSFPSDHQITCCEDEILFLAVEDQYLSSAIEFSPPVLQFLFSPPLSEITPVADLLIAEIDRSGHPPELTRSEAVLFQVFRL